jgi:tetratricopeptide (TPR) repeat protein
MSTPADRQSLGELVRLAGIWLTSTEVVLGAGNVGCYEARNNLASSLARTGQFAQAQPLFERSFQLARRTMGERSIYTTKVRGMSARCMVFLGLDLREASERARSASEDILLSDPIGTDWWFYYQTILASATRQRGLPEDALAILHDALAARAPLNASLQSPWADTYAQTELGLAHLDQGDRAQALAALLRARELARIQNDPTSGFRFDRALLATRLGVDLDPDLEELAPAGSTTHNPANSRNQIDTQSR